DMKAKMEERNNTVADNAVQEQLIAALVEKMEADIPEPMIENEVENQVRDFDMRLRQQGMDLKTYFQYTGLDLDGMRDQFRPMAERQVKARLALEGVVAAEGITASDEEIAAEYDELAKAYNMSADDVKKYIDDESVAKDITVRKAIDLVKEAAVITEKTVGEASDAAAEETEA
ncbi:MAG: trigger factor, partial [Clostridia bacterium]|nr:trigger factor [Clostridia bacterium]